MRKSGESLAAYCTRRLLELSLAAVEAGRRLKYEQRGQGTTEYAILVGVLVVIAIIAVIAFRENLQQLWEDISESINSL
ncbi:MAG: hypothetical protein LBL23_07415 [Coriobacteriales bacterium]|nr:hypothetical protein [Coriobacteriales bacterium]